LALILPSPKNQLVNVKLPEALNENENWSQFGASCTALQFRVYGSAGHPPPGPPGQSLSVMK
jgi:hypothetical protein